MQRMPELVHTDALTVDIDARAAPRFTLLIRTAKLIVEDRQYLCVVRDVSATGASVRTFHPLAEGRRTTIEFDAGNPIAADIVWQNEKEAGFQFHCPINVDDIVMGLSDFPKRDLRFDVEHPVAVQFGGQSCDAQLTNISREGGLVRCDLPMALDQIVRLNGKGFGEIEARVRWRQDGFYGLVFDTTFSLADLAVLVQRINSHSIEWKPA